MNGKKVKWLKSLIKDLPPALKEQRVKVSGSELLAENPEATDNVGEPINPVKEYIIDKAIEVNHFNEIKKFYELDKINGAGNYCKQVMEYHEKNSGIEKS